MQLGVKLAFHFALKDENSVNIIRTNNVANVCFARSLRNRGFISSNVRRCETPGPQNRIAGSAQEGAGPKIVRSHARKYPAQIL